MIPAPATPAPATPAPAPPPEPPASPAGAVDSAGPAATGEQPDGQAIQIPPAEEGAAQASPSEQAATETEGATEGQPATDQPPEQPPLDQQPEVSVQQLDGQYGTPLQTNEEQLSPLVQYLDAGNQAGFVEHFQQWQGSDPYAFFQAAGRVGGQLQSQGLQMRLGSDGKVSLEPAASWQYGRADVAQPGEPVWAVAAPAGNLVTPNRPGELRIEDGGAGQQRFGMAQGLPGGPGAGGEQPAPQPQAAGAGGGGSDQPPPSESRLPSAGEVSASLGSLGSFDNVTSIFGAAGTAGSGGGPEGGPATHGEGPVPAGEEPPQAPSADQQQADQQRAGPEQQATPQEDGPKDGVYWDHENRAYYHVEDGRWAESHMLGIQVHPSTGYERDSEAQSAAGRLGAAENPGVLYDGGHGAAHLFGAEPGQINLSAMVRGLNRGSYKTMENAIGKMYDQAVKDDPSLGQAPYAAMTPEERRADPFKVDTGIDLHVRGVYPQGSDVPSHYEVILDNRGTIYRTTFVNTPGPQPRWNEKEVVPNEDW